MFPAAALAMVTTLAMTLIQVQAAPILIQVRPVTTAIPVHQTPVLSVKPAATESPILAKSVTATQLNVLQSIQVTPAVMQYANPTVWVGIHRHVRELP